MQGLSLLSSCILLALIAGVGVYGLYKKVDLFDALTKGAKTGLGVIFRVLPTLVCLLSAIYMLRASGFFEAMGWALTPVFELLGLPPELTPLMLIRPISGSGALAVGSELMVQYGPDSYIGRVASVLLGATETTFYTIAVYFTAARVKKTGYTLPAALVCDVTAFVAAAFFVRLLMGS